MPPTPPSSAGRDAGGFADGKLTSAGTAGQDTAADGGFEKELEDLFSAELAAPDGKPAPASSAAKPEGKDVLDLGDYAVSDAVDVTAPEETSGGKNGAVDADGLDELINSLGTPGVSKTSPSASLSSSSSSPEEPLDLSLDELVEEPAAKGTEEPASAGPSAAAPSSARPSVFAKPSAPAAEPSAEALTLPDFSEPEPASVPSAGAPSAEGAEVTAAGAASGSAGAEPLDLSLDELVEEPAAKGTEKTASAGPSAAAPSPARPSVSAQPSAPEGGAEEPSAGNPPATAAEPAAKVLTLADFSKPEPAAEEGGGEGASSSGLSVLHAIVPSEAASEKAAAAETPLETEVPPPSPEAGERTVADVGAASSEAAASSDGAAPSPEVVAGAPGAEVGPSSTETSTSAGAAADVPAGVDLAAGEEPSAPAASSESASAGTNATEAVLRGELERTKGILSELKERFADLTTQVTGGDVAIMRLEGRLAEKDRALERLGAALKSSQAEAALLRSDLTDLRGQMEETLHARDHDAELVEKISSGFRERLTLVEDRQREMDDKMHTEVARAVPREAARVIREEIAALAASMHDE